MTSPPAKNALPWLIVSIAVIALDQWSKNWVLASLPEYTPVVVIEGFWNWYRSYNTGAAFSFLAGASGWQRWFFVGLGLAASALIIWMMRSHPGQKLFCFAVSLVMGGALGNVIDRLLHGYVVDFLQFRFDVLSPLFHGGYFPAFNLADSAITLGAVCLVLDELLRVRRAG